MDDFGTGYSSLGYLQLVSVRQDQDRPLVHLDHQRDGDDKATPIVRSVISLGQSLSMMTTAEGVETLEQRPSLRRKAASRSRATTSAVLCQPKELTLLSRTGVDSKTAATASVAA